MVPDKEKQNAILQRGLAASKLYNSVCQTSLYKHMRPTRLREHYAMH